jgi:hypothetical protein
MKYLRFLKKNKGHEVKWVPTPDHYYLDQPKKSLWKPLLFAAIVWTVFFILFYFLLNG